MQSRFGVREIVDGGESQREPPRWTSSISKFVRATEVTKRNIEYISEPGLVVTCLYCKNVEFCISLIAFCIAIDKLDES